MTRTDLLTQWALRLNKTPPPAMDPLTESRGLGFLNQRQRRLLSLPGLRHLREATMAFASTVGQSDYGFVNIAKILRLWDPTNERVLYEMTQQDLRLTNPQPISGTPEAFIWRGRQEVLSQPVTSGVVLVQSTSAADTTQTVFVEGTTTFNYPRAVSLTLTGTVQVNVAPSITNWARVDKFYLSAPPVGAVTLFDGAVGFIAIIGPGQTYTDYTGITLWPTPSAALSYNLDFTRTLTDLASGGDVPFLPEDFHDVLLLGAVMDEYQHLNDTRYSVAKAEYDKRVGEMQIWLAETAIGRPWSLSRGWQRPSALGSWYPAGT